MQNIVVTAAKYSLYCFIAYMIASQILINSCKTVIQIVFFLIKHVTIFEDINVRDIDFREVKHCKGMTNTCTSTFEVMIRNSIIMLLLLHSRLVFVVSKS